MKQNEITINIIGESNTGKSRVAFMIKELFKELEFETELIQIDYKDENEFDRHTSKNLNEVLEALSKKTKIIIKEVQLARKLLV